MSEKWDKKSQDIKCNQMNLKRTITEKLTVYETEAAVNGKELKN